MAYGIVYCAFDVSNGKFYIGQTVSGFEIRKLQHLKLSRDFRAERKRRLFHNTLRKREDCFAWSVLTTVSNQVDLDLAERYWIKFFESFGDGGYNLNEGGRGHGKRDDSTREKMRMAKLGKKQHPEWLAARKAGLLGRVQTEETRQKLRDIAKEQWKRRYAGDEKAVGRRSK